MHACAGIPSLLLLPVLVVEESLLGLVTVVLDLERAVLDVDVAVVKVCIEGGGFGGDDEVGEVRDGWTGEADEGGGGVAVRILGGVEGEVRPDREVALAGVAGVAGVEGVEERVLAGVEGVTGLEGRRGRLGEVAKFLSGVPLASYCRSRINVSRRFNVLLLFRSLILVILGL